MINISYLHQLKTFQGGGVDESSDSLSSDRDANNSFVQIKVKCQYSLASLL